MAVFVDRVAAKPNRYKVVPENGGDGADGAVFTASIVNNVLVVEQTGGGYEDGATFYAVLERADEPIVEGTMLNAETLNNIQPDPYLTAVVE